MPSLTTEGASEWVDGWSPALTDETQLWKNIKKRGRSCLRAVSLPTKSDDLVVLAYLCWEGMGGLFHAHALDEDWMVAGDVLDNYVRDADAELLCELVPLTPEAPVGGMSPAVTAVHTALLCVCGAMRDRWEDANAGV